MELRCDICGRTTGHDSRCPNFTPTKASHYCSTCGEGIYDGEEYIKNLDGEYAHYDCLTDLSCRAMIEWLGGEIRIMEGDYGEDY